MRLDSPCLRFALLAAACLTAAPLTAETVRGHFDSDAIIRPPGFFDFVAAGAPGAARWIVVAEKNAPSAPNALAQVTKDRPADSVALAVRRNYVFQDGSASTFVKRFGGRAGVVLRMTDERNFVLLLVDAASGETVLSSWREGRPTELGRGQATLAREWEKFTVAARGSDLTVSFGDTKLFEAKDPKPATGKAGLATAGPGEARFDEFVLEF